MKVRYLLIFWGTWKWEIWQWILFVLLPNHSFAILGHNKQEQQREILFMFFSVPDLINNLLFVY